MGGGGRIINHLYAELFFKMRHISSLRKLKASFPPQFAEVFIMHCQLLADQIHGWLLKVCAKSIHNQVFVLFAQTYTKPLKIEQGGRKSDSIGQWRIERKSVFSLLQFCKTQGLWKLSKITTSGRFTQNYLPAAFIFPLESQCQNKAILLQHTNQNILKSKQLFKIHIPIKPGLTKIYTQKHSHVKWHDLHCKERCMQLPMENFFPP